MKLFMKENTIITCPDCKRKIATAKRDLYSGERAMVRDFCFESDILACQGMQATCPDCGTYYMYLGSIHTQNGWLGRGHFPCVNMLLATTELMVKKIESVENRIKEIERKYEI